MHMAHDFFHTIETLGEAEFRDRGSRFIAYAFPIGDTGVFKNILAEKKKEHPKAVHHCFAYRLGFTGDQFRANDDGEPSGSAGRPILGQIDSRGLTDTAVVVVRYFGGTLLGIPGLIQAYGTVASLALDTCRVVQKPVTDPFELLFDYRFLNEVMRICKQHDIFILDRDMGLFCRFRIAVPRSSSAAILQKFSDFPHLEINKLV